MYSHLINRLDGFVCFGNILSSYPGKVCFDRRKGQTMPVFILAFSTRRRGENLEVCSQRFNLTSAQTYKINLGL